MTRWHELAWPDVADAVAATPFGILPFGAVEEHGPHLPLGTDTLAAERFAERIAERTPLIQFPAMPYGQVWSLEHFAGSVSVPDEVLIALVRGVAAGFARAGGRGLVLYSGHLGNAAALKRATRVLEEEGGLPALALTYPGIAAAARHVRESPESHPAILHADEIETSVLLALAPEVVRMERAVSEYPDYPGHFDAAPVRWHTVSDTGVFGDATAATPEKGEALVESVVDAAVAAIDAWKEAVS